MNGIVTEPSITIVSEEATLRYIRHQRVLLDGRGNINLSHGELSKPETNRVVKHVGRAGLSRPNKY